MLLSVVRYRCWSPLYVSISWPVIGNTILFCWLLLTIWWCILYLHLLLWPFCIPVWWCWYIPLLLFTFHLTIWSVVGILYMWYIHSCSVPLLTVILWSDVTHSILIVPNCPLLILCVWYYCQYSVYSSVVIPSIHCSVLYFILFFSCLLMVIPSLCIRVRWPTPTFVDYWCPVHSLLLFWCSSPSFDVSPNSGEYSFSFLVIRDVPCSWVFSLHSNLGVHYCCVEWPYLMRNSVVFIVSLHSDLDCVCAVLCIWLWLFIVWLYSLLTVLIDIVFHWRPIIPLTPELLLSILI